jgi:serine/threonine-protein kinase
MIGQTISHYRIISELGRGGMGIVYLAEDTLLGRQVAIKTLTEGGLGKQHFRTRFLREARAVSALSHANIATIHDYGETIDGHPYIVMEFVKGQTLADLISESKLTLERSIEIIIDVAKALGEAHHHGIVHRDIKPSNIAINERGQVKVLDFGLAKQIDNVSSIKENAGGPALDNTQTREGVVVGTPLYFSPEQAMGVAVDARSDLFSLGSVLYECIAGRPPFSAPSFIEICAKVIRDEPDPPSRINSLVSVELDRVSFKSLAKKPEERHQSAAEFVDSLGAAVGSLKDQRETHRTTPKVEPANTSILHTPVTVGTTNITVGAVPSRFSVGKLFLAVGFISLAAFGLWYVLRPKAYEPSAAALEWYEQGTRALQDGTYYKASKMLDEAVKQDKKFAIAHARLAEAWAELGYFDKASAEISQANLLVKDSSLSRLDLLYLQAINATVTHDFKGAIDSYQQMFRSAQVKDKPHILVDLGRAYEKNEDLPNAVANYKEAAGSDPQYAPAFLHEGVLYGRLQDFDKGKAALDKAFALYERQSNPEGMAEALYQNGFLFNSKGETKQAREPLEQALQFARTFTNPSQEVKTLLQLSSVFRLTKDFETAKRYATEALDLASTNGLSDLKTQSIIELGYAFFYDSKIADAEKYFQQGLQLAQAENVRVSEARAQFALGSMHIQQDEADAGIPYIKQALPFYEQNVYRKEVMLSQTLLGQAYALKGDLSEALKAHETELRLAQELNNQLQAGLSHKSIGTVLGNQEKYSDAFIHIEQSYSIFNALGNDLYLGYSLMSRADMEWRLGHYKDAEADLNLAQSLAEEPKKSKQFWGRLYGVRAQLKLSQLNFRDASRDAREAIKTDTSRTQHSAIEAETTLGLALFLSGDKRGGKRICELVVQKAEGTANPRLLLGALLALAETMIESDDAKAALENAMRAQELSERADQIESEWRALLIAGRASNRLGDYKTARAILLRADSLRSNLQQRWGAAYYNSYLSRPDVVRLSKQLTEASTTSGKD